MNSPLIKVDYKLLSQIDAICDQFEAGLLSGSEPVIEDFLKPDWSTEENSLLLEQLLELEMDYRRKDGEECSLDDYSQRFPVEISRLNDTARNLQELTTPSKSATPKDEANGRMIREYQLDEQIGVGGMGTVYRATHTRLNRPVAMKLLPEDKLQDAQMISRFDREMKLVGGLRHPHIVSAIDAGEYAGRHFLVMELLEGMDLSSLVKQHGPLEIADACELVRQAALGLQCAHEHGMVHRDIKPSNLMLCQPACTDRQGKPVVKLLDLGLARLHTEVASEQSLTGQDQVMGTLDYMSPEQALNSRDVDIRADIYSLGATLHRLLVGKPLWSGEDRDTAGQKFQALLTQHVPSIKEHRSDLPEALVAVVNRALSRDPENRYQTPIELEQALEPFTAGHQLSVLLGGTPTVVASDVDTKIGTVTLAPTEAVPETSSPKRVWLWTALVPAVLLLAGVFWLKTDGGYIRIEAASDVDLTVEVLKDGETVETVEIRKLKEAVFYRAANYEIRLPESAGEQYRIEGNQFTLTRKGRQTVTITRITGEQQTVKNTPNEPITKPDGIGKGEQKANWIPGSDEGEMIGLAPLPAKMTGEVEWQLQTTTGHHREIAISPDGSLLALVSDRNIWLFDTNTKRPRLIIRPEEPPSQVRWSPDNSAFLVRSGKGSRIWNVDGSSGLELPTPLAVWSPDGKKIACGFEKRMIFLSPTGEEKRESTPAESESQVQELIWNPDGTSLVSVHEDQILRLWNTDATLKTKVKKRATVASWSPDGQYLACSLPLPARATPKEPDDHLGFLCNAAGELVKHIPFRGILWFSWHPKGKGMIFLSPEHTSSRIMWYLSERGLAAETIDPKKHVRNIGRSSSHIVYRHWHPNGNRFLYGEMDRGEMVSRSHLYKWNDALIKSENALPIVPAEPSESLLPYAQISLSKTARGNAWLHDDQVGFFTDQFLPDEDPISIGRAPGRPKQGWFWSPDSQQFALRTISDWTIATHLWTSDFRERVTVTHPRFAELKWTPDGQRLAILSGGVLQFVSRDGKPLPKLELDFKERFPGFIPRRIAFHPDTAQRVLLGTEKETWLVSLDDLEAEPLKLAGAMGEFSPTGKHFYTLDGSTARIWTDTGDKFSEYKFSSTSPKMLLWSPDGRYLNVTGYTPGVAVISVEGKASPEWESNKTTKTPLGWSPDGSKLLLSHSALGYAAHWVGFVDPGKTSMKKPIATTKVVRVSSTYFDCGPSGHIAQTEPGKFVVYDPAGKPHVPQGYENLARYGQSIVETTWSPDGKWLIGFTPHLMVRWATEDLTLDRVVVLGKENANVIFSAAGELLLSDGDSEHSMWYVVKPPEQPMQFYTPKEFREKFTPAQ